MNADLIDFTNEPLAHLAISSAVSIPAFICIIAVSLLAVKE